MRKKRRNSILLWVVILLPYVAVSIAGIWYINLLKEIKNANFILVDKQTMTLSLFSYNGTLLHKSFIATGKNFGNKNEIGDLKTPEGVFKVIGIENASAWTHDFKDDTLGLIEGAYGPYFIRLEVPGHKGIGIHGTHDDNSLGTRASEGCIRMNNAELKKVVKLISRGSIVIITPGIKDIELNK